MNTKITSTRFDDVGYIRTQIRVFLRTHSPTDGVSCSRRRSPLSSTGSTLMRTVCLCSGGRNSRKTFSNMYRWSNTRENSSLNNVVPFAIRSSTKVGTKEMRKISSFLLLSIFSWEYHLMKEEKRRTPSNLRQTVLTEELNEKRQMWEETSARVFTKRGQTIEFCAGTAFGTLTLPAKF